MHIEISYIQYTTVYTYYSLVFTQTVIFLILFYCQEYMETVKKS